MYWAYTCFTSKYITFLKHHWFPQLQHRSLMRRQIYLCTYQDFLIDSSSKRRFIVYCRFITMYCREKNLCQYIYTSNLKCTWKYAGKFSKLPESAKNATVGSWDVLSSLFSLSKDTDSISFDNLRLNQEVVTLFVMSSIATDIAS